MRNSCSGQLEEVRSVRSKQDALLHGSRSSRLLAQWKHTVTPILILSCLLQFRWPTALLYAAWDQRVSGRCSAALGYFGEEQIRPQVLLHSHRY